MPNVDLFPSSILGSLPRPRWLIQVLRDRDKGNIPDIEWQSLAEYAVREALDIQEGAALDIISDGEQRRDGFLTFVLDRLFGLRRMSLEERLRAEDAIETDALLTASHVPTNAIKSPVVTDTVRVLNPHKGIVLEEVDYLRQQATQKIRVSLPGPYTLSRTLWTEAHSKRVYETADDLAGDLVELLRDEIKQLAQRNVAVIQIDEPALARLADRSSGATFAGAFLPAATNLELERSSAITLVNALTAGNNSVPIMLHVSKSSWSRSDTVSHSVDLHAIEPLVEQLDVAQLALGAFDPDDAEMEILGRLSQSKSIALSVVSAWSDAVESPELIVERTQRALKYIQSERIILAPDTGFAPFAERNLTTSETAKAKLESMAEASRHLRGG
jgi:5-methyltetrahydropteroyltriglutamate--homocysteine methyltransferase